MPRLPPAEKLPLAVRKDSKSTPIEPETHGLVLTPIVRDNWENKKEDLEKQISNILGETWTINIDPKAIWPYGEDNSWAKTSTGDLLAR